MSKREYLSGFGNHFQTEAEKGALPKDQNSPQKTPKGLFAEQHSATSFVVPRHENRTTWVYRLHPSVSHGGNTDPKLVSQGKIHGAPFRTSPTPPTQIRWDPLPLPKSSTDFLDGLVTFAGNGDQALQVGSAIHLYAANASMQEKGNARFFSSSDGELLIVPEQGDLEIKTEYGVLEIEPLEIAVIPRGCKFQVNLNSKAARGYVLENFGALLRLPHLGPIGANGLAHPRHFLSPVAAYEEKKGSFEVVTKFQGHLWTSTMKHSPLDVVAWHGNLAPYKYDLRLFNTVNTVSFDHMDPSIFTVLTSPSDTVGAANVDFVIFPPRWMVADHTFRPPYYHRNVMSEYMGNILGKYDAKESGFIPGGGSLHNCMSPHGPDLEAYTKAIESDLKPDRLKDTMSFMFESRYVYHPTDFAMKSGLRQRDYAKCWSGL